VDWGGGRGGGWIREGEKGLTRCAVLLSYQRSLELCEKETSRGPRNGQGTLVGGEKEGHG